MQLYLILILALALAVVIINTRILTLTLILATNLTFSYSLNIFVRSQNNYTCNPSESTPGVSFPDWRGPLNYSGASHRHLLR